MKTRTAILCLCVFLIALLMVLSGCESSQRVKINNSSVTVDNLILSIRNGYNLSENVYDIEETAEGYDIIIHVEKANE